MNVLKIGIIYHISFSYSIDPRILQLHTDTRTEEEKKKMKKWLEITGCRMKLRQKLDPTLCKIQVLFLYIPYLNWLSTVKTFHVMSCSLW